MRKKIAEKKQIRRRKHCKQMTSHDKYSDSDDDDGATNNNDIGEEKCRKNADAMLTMIQNLGPEIKPSYYGNVMAQERLKIGKHKMISHKINF